MNSRLESRPPRLRTGSKSCAPSPASPPPSGAPNNSYLREYALIAEYGLVQRRPLPGIYVIPSEQSCATWHGVAFPRAGLYRGGAYRFTLDIPAAYPDAPPRVVFAPPPFHPLVDAATGALDVARAFRPWRRHAHHVRDVLAVVSRCFSRVDVEYALNPHAAALYRDDLELFKDKVARGAVAGREALLADARAPPGNAHRPRFSSWDAARHADARNRLLRQSPPEGAGYNAQVSGLSWVAPGTSQLFST